MAFNRKNSEVNGAELEKIAALEALDRKDIGVNNVEPERMRRLTGKIAASTSLNRKRSGVNGAGWKNGSANSVELKKGGINGVESEKERR